MSACSAFRRLAYATPVLLAVAIASCAVASCGVASCAVVPASGPGTRSASGAIWATDTDVAWAEMARELVGRWKATTPDNRSFVASYRLVSNGSALVETFTSSSSGKETLSVYHHDGRALLLTHYCAQGNQARLEATVATRERIVFEYLDATNLRAEQDVMQRLTFVLRADGFDQESVYRLPSGELETTTLRFFRADPAVRSPAPSATP